jgi:hypothetical protein
MHRLQMCLLTATVCCSLPHSLLAAESKVGTTQTIPMTSGHWRPVSGKPDVHYVTQEGFPDGIIVLKSGDLALNDFTFRDGTIDFDMKPLAEDIPGIRFRQRDPENGEEFYIRSLPDCRAENDCIQYSPVINGFLLWDVYPEYQSRAPVLPAGWNHVRLVVSGKRMNVFINDSIQPTLSVGELLGDTQAGGLELHGPAAFANLTVSAGKTDGLSPVPLPDSMGNSLGIVHDWLLGPLTPLHYGSPPTYAERPHDSAAWKRLHSERFGILNLNRQFHASKEPAALTWVMTSIDSDQDQIKQISLGWLGQAWIFVNGALITSGKNFYYPDSERRFPDGRLSLQNGSFPVPLRRGHNEIVIAVYDSVHDDGSARTKYGWGLAMRYDDVRGLSVPR